MKVNVCVQMTIEVNDDYDKSDVLSTFEGMTQFEDLVMDFLEDENIDVISCDVTGVHELDDI